MFSFIPVINEEKPKSIFSYLNLLCKCIFDFMTKTGSTKNKMLNIIASGNKTLSDISRELGLAPSTVSQHIQELKAMGAILIVDNPHIKKWKYYRLNPDFDFAGSGIGQGIEPSKIKIPNRTFYYSIAIVLLGAVALSLFGSNAISAGSAFHALFALIRW